ncbi:DUF6702 family protein [Jejuia spongiicola]|uniref:Peptidase E n=1 Tax=Jejuia spongiicola TaxID=2942207 RepID=A0ABT0QBE6_9FLAO|nr:DUF6702 family protein [Jejuia spongiicola]MCL6294219.1 peptidase E [Jejuia spongiicola]
MKFTKSFFLFLIIPLLAFTTAHKYYVSVTQINYIKEKESVQITSRIFIDDFENLLRKRYDENITLADKNELEIVDTYIERYLNDKIKIKINNKDAKFNFIGKEYDADIMRCYLEIEGVKAINTFQITNQLLFDLYEEQQNIVKTKINAKQKSYLLIPQKDNALLNFN